ncbi:hypothetical protein [uncultured Hyphomonas sp.]|uniref:hypothetical protein n=1 Tax=uncultured Hyphomonas sp. TaxID=225298 RepID=UPI002AAB00FA|nr:hypothetical protein [uncultured Hyphomonas sp.]
MPEEWKRKLEFLGSNETIEAVGALALFYNEVEFSIYALFQFYLQMPSESTSKIFSTLGNRQRSDIIKAFGQAEQDTQARELVPFAMNCFDICAENRNLILHAVPGYKETPSDILSLLKSSRENPHMLKRYEFKVSQIRRAGLAMSKMADFIYDLSDALIDLREGKEPSWPLKPPKPRTLASYS